MIKRIICFFSILIISLGMIRIDTKAAVIDHTKDCSLSLTYSKESVVFPDLDIDIYRVAEINVHGGYELVDPFSQYPVKVQGVTSKQEWLDIAQTLKNYVVANNIAAYQSQKTSAEGKAEFSGLKTGLYLVKGVKTQNKNGMYEFLDFLVSLPAPAENDYQYHVEAKPKSTQYTPVTAYSVVKLWNDAQDPSARPASVSVQILKEGKVQETVALNSQNNWSYSWNVYDSNENWSVMEINVDAGYQVSIVKNNTAFIITNTRKPEEPEIPKTGDTSPILFYVILLCVSGLGLIILGIIGRRGKKDE